MTKPFDLCSITLTVGYNDHTLNPDWDKSLDQLAATGANVVVIEVNVYLPDPSSVDFSALKSQAEDVADLRDFLTKIEQRGMAVALKPAIKFLVGGDINQAVPQDLDAWFKGYESLLVDYANLAQQMESPFLVIGNEIPISLTSSHRESWAHLIARVREVYAGELTINAQNPTAAANLSFGDLLDFIGTSFYSYAYTHDPNADLDDLVAAWNSSATGQNLIQLIETIHERFGKPVAITEIAYRAVDGYNTFPWDGNVVGTVDEAEQRDLYDSFLLAWTAVDRPWFKGVSFWGWFSETDPTNGPRDPLTFDRTQPWYGEQGSSVQGKLAFDTLTQWFQGLRQSQVPPKSGLMSSDMLLGGYGHDTMNAGSGNDVLIGGPGNDTLIGGPDRVEAALASTIKLSLQGNFAEGDYPRFLFVVNGVRVGSEVRVDRPLSNTANYTTVEVTVPSIGVSSLAIEQVNWLINGPDANRFLRLKSLSIDGQAIDRMSVLYDAPGEQFDTAGGMDTNRGGRLVVDTTTLQHLFNGSLSVAGDDDILEGGRGDDLLLGGSGIDTARFAARKADVSLQPMAGMDGWLVNALGEGRDRLTSIERLQFADTHIALDLDGHAGDVARVIGALFGPDALSDASLVGVGLKLRDGGMRIESLISAALQSPLFELAAGGLSDLHFVRHVYENVMGIAPSASEEARFVGLLSTGHSRTELAVLACSDPLTALAIDLVGLSASGLDYVPAA